MGHSLSKTVNDTSQIAVNEIIQKTRTTCIASCKQNVDNVNIVVTNGSIIGDIIISQKCEAVALCSMKTNLDTIATQQLDTIQNGEAIALARTWINWPGTSVAVSKNTTHQELYNSVTQSINNFCNATVENSVTNLNVYISDYSEVGAFTIQQEGNAQANCTIENITSASVTQQASSSQTAKASAGSVLLMIVALLVIMIIVIGVIYLNNKTSIREKELQSENFGKIVEASKDNPDLLKLYLDTMHLNALNKTVQ